MALSPGQIALLLVFGIILLAKPAHAFGAGNIGSTSKIEGENWRHGDLEDTLLMLMTSKAMGGKKFSKLDVKRVYFGNWLRDYSQAVDVGTVKYVSAEAIRILLWVLGFMSFGYGSREFEVTTERLGCYRPEEHIDNPKDYADNEDARQYDRRLRGPVNERRELAVNPETGLKNYIATENLGIDTSAGLVRKLFSRSIELGRRYGRDKNKADLYEALRLLGTGCHCLEDYAAHSNYTELALIELGERDIFPHVGRRTSIQLREARKTVFPLVTGTFGGVDFLHSVCGEFDDKATQSEIQELENAMQGYQNKDQSDSVLQDLLSKVPSGIFGGTDEAGKAEELKTNAAAAQMQNAHVSPREPEEWVNYLTEVQNQIRPIMEWHDEVMQSITETMENIPILPDLIDSIQEEVNKFVFSLIAPFVLPIINQIKSELNTGSNEIIQSSMDKQHIVFNDDESSDPTHSMLSKDHFSNILNEVAGKVASQTVKWVVPQLIACWDDERLNVDECMDRIVNGVLHHPALRDFGRDGVSDGRRLMFGVVENWWTNKSEREKDEYRQKLGRRGVETGQNHKPGVKDHGHGSAKPLGMANLHSSGGPSFGGVGSQATDSFGKMAAEAVGGGALGALVGEMASNIGSDVISSAMGGDTETYQQSGYGQDGSYNQTVTQIGANKGRYGQAQVSHTEYPGGGRRDEYSHHEQTSSGGHQSDFRREEHTSSSYRQETHSSNTYGSGSTYSTTTTGRLGGGNDDYNSMPGGFNSRTDDSETNYGRRRKDDDDNERRSGYGRRQEESSGYGAQEPTYGRHQEESSGYGRRQEESSGYGRRQEEYSGYGSRTEHASGGYGRKNDDNDDNRRRRNDDDDETPTYGRRRNDDDETPAHGRRRNDDDETPAYGRRRNDHDDNENTGYGRRRNDDDENQGGFGGGYSGRKQNDDDNENEGYGRPRRNDDDDDNENRKPGRRYGGGNDDDRNRGYGGGRGW